MIDKTASMSGSLSGTGSLKNSYEKTASLSGNLSSQLVNTDYNTLSNIPTINGVIVKGNLTSKDLKIERGYDASVDPLNDEHLILKT